MSQTIETIFENGVFKPLKHVNLPEHNKFEIIILNPLKKNDKKLKKSDQKLLDLLNHPVSMGKTNYKNRKDIYDDID